VADVTGDGRVDVVGSNTNGLFVRSRRSRSIPLRFVVFSASPSDNDINASVASLNRVYNRDFGLNFTIIAPILHPAAPGFADGLDSSVESNTLTDVDLKAAYSFNPTCDRGTELANVSEYKALSRIAARCAKPGELLVYVATTDGHSQGLYPWEANFIRFDPAAFVDPSDGAVPHEVAHYLGLPHVFGPEVPPTHPNYAQRGYDLARHPNLRNPKTGQETGLSTFWDLVYAQVGSQFLTFDGPEAAASNEPSLLAIQASTGPARFNDGWFCPGDGTHPCPPGGPAPTGTLGLGVGDPMLLSQIWYGGSATTSYFGSQQLKGLGLQVGDVRDPLKLADGGPGINSMSYGYLPSGDASYRYGFGVSQVEQVQRSLSYDVPLPTLDASGHVLMSGRPLLGTTASPRSLSYEQVPGSALTTPGSIASNGFDTWVVGGGNSAYRWNPVRRTFDGPFGTQVIQVSVPSNGMSNAASAIIGTGDHGTVKSWDGSSFAPLSHGEFNCAYSLAVGTTYTWVIGCDAPNGSGDRTIYRYSPQTGWMADTHNGWAVEIAVDASGTPWVRNSANRIYKGVLDGAGMPVWTWTPGIGQHLGSGAVYGSILSGTGNGTLPDGVAKDLSISVIGMENPAHVYAQRNDPGLNFADNGAPPVNFVQVAGSLPYIWGVDAGGGIWYSH
jgi:hypothetical protein